MKNLSILLAFILSPFLLLSQVADKVFKNAKVYVGNNSFEEALAIKDGNIIYVGSDVGVAAHIGAGTEVGNLDGRLMLPGIHDVHTHPLEAGSPAWGDCFLDPFETDPENFIPFLQNCNLSPNPNGWIVGFGHSIFTFFDAPLSSRYPYEILDDVYPNTPAIFMEEKSHSVWVNSTALTTLGINASTPDPVGGHIVKDEFNNDIPIGILLDGAGDIALAIAFATHPIIDAQHKEGLVDYSLPLMAENGITSICEARTYWKNNFHQVWQSIKDDGALTCRVILAPWGYPEDDDATLISALQALYDEGDDMLRTTQVKIYSDGLIINATAAMHEPYDYNWELPFDRGLNYIDETRMTNLITSLEQIGYDFHIHAIGDRGITESLNAIESARATNGNIGARHRVTHVEVVDPLDFNRFAQLNVTADMQVAGTATDPANWHLNEDFIGNRADNFVPLKSLKNANARITLSSDWDVSTVNPFVAMENALTRSPQELASIEEVLAAYTIDAAYVMRQETQTGSLAVGKWADFIVVDRDIFTIPTNQIGNTEVLLTYVGGEEVFREPGLTLPIELLYFDVKKADCVVELEWVTALERDFDRFVIERSHNGKYYEVIGEVKGNNRVEESIYHFTDKQPRPTNYYRLRQIDNNGREDVSPAVSANKSCDKELSFQITPNLTNYLTMIQLTGGEDDEIEVQLLSAQGRLIKSFALQHRDKITQSPLNVTFLPEGIYYVRIFSKKNGKEEMKSFVVSR